jgi:hypothetical protein
MLIQIMKWATIGALLLTATFWSSAANYQPLVGLLVSFGAGIVLVQASRAKEYALGAAFIVIGVVFNPIAPILALSGDANLLFVMLCIVPFAVSLSRLKTQPRLSVASITDRNPGGESL